MKRAPASVEQNAVPPSRPPPGAAEAAGSLDRLLSELAVGFVGTGTTVDEAIRRVLERVVSTLGVDVAFLLEVVGDERRLRTTHMCAAPDGDTELPEFFDDGLSWLAERLGTGRPIRIAGADELPPTAIDDRRAMGRLGLESVVVCPVIAERMPVGAVAFGAVRCRWPEPLVDHLCLVGQLFAGALARRHLETRLTDEADLTESLIQSMPGMLFILDDQGRLVRWNRSHETVLGYSAAELRLRHFFTFTPPEDHEVLLDIFQQALRDDAVVSIRHGIVCKDGQRIPYLVTGRGIMIRGRRYAAGMSIDVSALDAAEEQVRRQQAELAHVARVSAMGELTAAIAHELNQPLTAIRTNAQATRRMLAAGASDPGEFDEALADITADAVRAGEIISRLRDLLRKGDPKRVSLDVNELIQAVEPFARADVLEHNAVLEMRLAPGLPPVLGDRIQLQQVVLNLVRNGSEAMRDEAGARRELVLATSLAAPDTIEVSVRDTGPSLSDDEFARMFQPFYTTKEGGLGIGLSLSRSIVEAHGGLLWATRNVGDDGLTMRFTLKTSPPSAR